MMPWLYSTSCPLTEYISVVTKERQICLPQSPPPPPTPPCIALRRPPLGVTLANALNAHSILRTCVQKSPPNFWGRWWDKNLVTPAQDPLSMSDLNLHPPPPPPLGVLLVEMRGCPTTFGIGRGSGGVRCKSWWNQCGVGLLQLVMLRDMAVPPPSCFLFWSLSFVLLFIQPAR